MKTVEGNPNTHYISSEEWDASYATSKPIIEKLSEGDLVIINRGTYSHTYTVVLKKLLEPI